MKNKPMYFSFLAVIITALAACFIRFFQFLKYTDAKSGLVVGDDLLTFVLYGVVALSLFFCFLYFFFSKRYERIIAFIGNKSIYITLLILSFTYFFDFVHQVYNCAQYISQDDTQNYIEYNYLLPMAFQAVFAILTCFYLIICAKSVKGTLIDFKYFKLFHLTPFLWGFCRLLVILTEIFDVESVESFLEFIFIVMYCGYTLCCASAVDSDDGKIKPLLSFFALSLFSVSIAFSLARILMILSGNYEDLSRVTFSALTYLFIGLFALNCELSVFITENVSKD
ncbi:MAG TPA: hypothetical protein OIM29_00075 [Oscillospiraceae bacterium]|nr:hypothetical protein [Oscillospiraceae bacterium]